MPRSAGPGTRRYVQRACAETAKVAAREAHRHSVEFELRIGSDERTEGDLVECRIDRHQRPPQRVGRGVGRSHRGPGGREWPAARTGGSRSCPNRCPSTGARTRGVAPARLLQARLR